jgi:hypothetical protein
MAAIENLSLDERRLLMRDIWDGLIAEAEAGKMDFEELRSFDRRVMDRCSFPEVVSRWKATREALMGRFEV